MITGEFKLIDAIRGRVDRAQGQAEKIYGIGDDCAVYTISENRYGLFSTDISIENVHFDLSYTPLFNAGYRSMTANISDIYAMGGKPVLALVSVGLPGHFTEQMTEELYDGILACAVKYGAVIAGGDTSKSDRLIVNISIYGETSSPVYRRGTSPGEYIYLTGSTGLSKLGLEILRSGKQKDDFPAAVERHLRPEPCGTLIDMILSEYAPTSMIDISDGILSDLGHIARMNKCGFELFADKIPAHAEILGYCGTNGLHVSDYTLYSGEEYELIFTSENKIIDRSGVSCIGIITPSGYILNSAGRKTAVELKGYDHFK